MESRIQDLCGFLNRSHSVYHAVAALTEILENAGYIRLREKDIWALQPGGKYYLTRNGSALAAFRVPRQTSKGFLISASHGAIWFLPKMADAAAICSDSDSFANLS